MIRREQLARFGQVNALLVLLIARNVTSEVARRMNAEVWAIAATVAGVERPGEEDIALVIADLEQVEKRRAA